MARVGSDFPQCLRSPSGHAVRVVSSAASLQGKHTLLELFDDLSSLSDDTPDVSAVPGPALGHRETVLSNTFDEHLETNIIKCNTVDNVFLRLREFLHQNKNPY